MKKHSGSEMTPPLNQKYLMKVDRSKTKTIKFKNGFPPKIIQPRTSFEDFARTTPHQRFQLVECEPEAKSNSHNPLMRNKSSHHMDEKPRSTVTPAPSVSRCGFSPSAVKSSPNHQRPSKAPFSPPPTFSELRSLTKKIGRFYTVNSNATSSAVTPVPNQQRVILDIEKALSRKDLQGLENCYKRIFNGNANPIRTMLRNQSHPNQRSHQALCSLSLHNSATSTRSSPIWSKNVKRDAPQQRRWSIDSVTERLPIVPAPYFRNEMPPSNRMVNSVEEGPVMFSSAPQRRTHREEKGTHTNTVNLNLDPERFPEPTARSSRLDGVTSQHQSRPTGRVSCVQKARRPIAYKSSSHWNQRAPTSTPEPYSRNEMQMNFGKQKDLLPVVIPAQFRQSLEQHRSGTSDQITRKPQRKLSKNRFDTSEACSDAEYNEASVDRKEITEDGLTERKRVLTSGGDSGTDCDYNDPKIHAPDRNKRAEERNLTSTEDSSISSDCVKQNSIDVVESTSRRKPNEGDSSDRDTFVVSAVENSMVENIDLEKLEINSVHSSSSETDENTAIFSAKAGSVKDSTIVDSRKLSMENLYSTREVEMNERKVSHMDSVNIVVVNVTTDEGEDVNADIYEYEKEKDPEHFEVGMETQEESNKLSEE